MRSKQVFIAIILSLVAQGSIADEGRWVLKNTNTDEAASPYGIKRMLNDYRYRSVFSTLKEKVLIDILVGEPASQLSTIKITTYDYHWEGPHSCTNPYDSRLNFQSQSSEACFIANGATTCQGSSVSIPVTSDPCQFSKTEARPLEFARTKVSGVSK